MILQTDSKIRKLTAKEISALVLEKLGFSISVDHIKRLTANLKRDCARELLLLQKDREYYLQRMFFDRVDELQYQQKVLHEIIDNNKESSSDISKSDIRDVGKFLQCIASHGGNDISKKQAQRCVDSHLG